MSGNDNETVTISAAYFAELYNAAIGDSRYKTLEAAYNQVRKERDELKAKLVADCRECVNRDEAKVLGDVLAAAERCIEEVWNKLGAIYVSADKQLDAIENTIRAYREAKEANNGR